jgi:hypothetical protein
MSFQESSSRSVGFSRVLRSREYASLLKRFCRLDLLGFSCLGSRPAGPAMAPLAASDNSARCARLLTVGEGEKEPLAVSGVDPIAESAE